MNELVRAYVNTRTDQSSSLELEARMGYYAKNGKFKPNVPRRLFVRFLEDMKSYVSGTSPIPHNLVEIGLTTFHEETVSDSIIYPSGIRKIVNLATGEVRTERKKKEYEVEDSNFGVRFTLSKEIRVQARDEVPKLIRRRVRNSFRFTYVTLDLTEVSSVQDGTSDITYEVEIEFNNDMKSKLSETLIQEHFINAVQVVYMNLKGTNNIYDIPTQESVTKFLSSMGITKDSLVQARNLKKSDFVYGGIVGNKNYSMYVTYKADGKRYMFVIHETGIWFISLPFDFNLIIPMTDSVRSIFGPLMNSVFDGEVLTQKDILVNINSFYVYFAFDCMISSGKDVRMLSYPERMQSCVRLTEITPKDNGVVDVEIKETRLISNEEEIFRLYQHLLSNRQSLPYKQDGLMMIPSGVYNPGSDKLPYRKRVLTKVQDVIKYKDVKDITIDFYIIRLANGKLSLKVYDEVSKTNIPFKGTRINPLTDEMIDHDNPLTRNANLMVFEYEFIDGKLRPKKARNDKAGPNSLGVAEANWDDINNPITDDDIMGLTNVFASAYQNRIKRAEFDFLRDQGVKTVVDIGSGYGQDLQKMFNMNVIAIEPNPKNLPELYKRIGIYGGNVKVIEKYGEDPSIVDDVLNIAGGQVDAVTMMLSLSFFWKSKEVLNALVDNIDKILKPGGYFAFLTIDGNSLLSTLDGRSEINLNGAEFRLVGGREVDVSISGIVGEHQREYLVFINDLFLRLRQKGINKVEYHKADGERLLPRESKLFTSMYGYGYCVKDGNNINESNVIGERQKARLFQDKIKTTLMSNPSGPSVIRSPLRPTVTSTIPSMRSSIVPPPLSANTPLSANAPSIIRSPLRPTVRSNIQIGSGDNEVNVSNLRSDNQRYYTGTFQ